MNNRTPEKQRRLVLKHFGGTSQGKVRYNYPNPKLHLTRDTVLSGFYQPSLEGNHRRREREKERIY